MVGVQSTTARSSRRLSVADASRSRSRSRSGSMYRQRRSSVVRLNLAPSLDSHYDEEQPLRKSVEKDVFQSQGTLLETWEKRGQSMFGLNRMQMLLIAGVTLVSSVITCTIIAGRLMVHNGHEHPVHHCGQGDLKGRERTTTIDLGVDWNGELETETVIETTGYDSQDHFCATRETKVGSLADAATMEILKRLDKSMAGTLRDTIDKMTGSTVTSDKLHLMKKGENKAIHAGQTDVEFELPGMEVEIHKV